ncbi:MAG: carbohydrate kinase family protein [Candidatus Woesearchaeota archaeon]
MSELYYDVVTVGSATIDVFAYSDKSEIIEIRSPKHNIEFITYPLGSKLALNEISYELGGGGTNTAATFTKLGFKTAFVGQVGGDFIGKEILKHIKLHNIEFCGIIRQKESSSFSIVLDSVEKDRTILAYKGVSNNPVKDTELVDALLYYYTSPGEEGINAYEKHMEMVHKNRSHIAFNPSSYIASLGAEKIKNLLNKTDILVLNAEELSLLSKDLVMKKGLDYTVREGIKLLHSYGPQKIAVTNGKKDVYASDGHHIYHSPIRKTKAVEATGAGDCFGATFAGMLIRKHTIKDALDYALINSASVVSFRGPKNGLLTMEQLNIVKKRVEPLKAMKYDI